MRKVMLIGDSHSEVTFPMIKEILTENGYNVVDSVSKIGWATYSYTKKPNTLHYGLSQNPDIIIVSLGGNNHYLKDNSYREKVFDFLNLIGYQNKKIVWISPFYATREDVQKRHLWTDEWLRSNLPRGVEYIDVLQYTPPIAADGVHYPKSSYRQIVSYIKDDLLKAIKPSIVRNLLIISAISSAILLFT